MSRTRCSQVAAFPPGLEQLAQGVPEHLRHYLIQKRRTTRASTCWLLLVPLLITPCPDPRYFFTDLAFAAVLYDLVTDSSLPLLFFHFDLYHHYDNKAFVTCVDCKSSFTLDVSTSVLKVCFLPNLEPFTLISVSISLIQLQRDCNIKLPSKTRKPILFSSSFFTPVELLGVGNSTDSFAYVIT